ncbi:hypothetical protein RIF29_38792 [Crotalaria pallida]|uniref:Uncharacterized protein n=1 Tax=Crotalaria pallida TaxID=3830 RepID=A0AAN9HQ25_CROPI
MWNCGEGTNGSVHSRFKPIGDGGVAFSNHGCGGGFSSFMQGNGSQYNITTSSDNHSFFPSELPARPRFETQSGDSRGKNSENMRVLEGLDGGKVRKPPPMVRKRGRPSKTPSSSTKKTPEKQPVNEEDHCRLDLSLSDEETLEAIDNLTPKERLRCYKTLKRFAIESRVRCHVKGRVMRIRILIIRNILA